MGSPAARVLRLAAALLGGMCGGSAIRSAITGSGHWPWLTAAALTLIGAAAAANLPGAPGHTPVTGRAAGHAGAPAPQDTP